MKVFSLSHHSPAKVMPLLILAFYIDTPYALFVSSVQICIAQACREVFEGLDRCEEILSEKRFLLGDRFTEADLRLLPTAVRFDAVYATLFKCSNK